MKFDKNKYKFHCHLRKDSPDSIKGIITGKKNISEIILSYPDSILVKELHVSDSVSEKLHRYGKSLPIRLKGSLISYLDKLNCAGSTKAILVFEDMIFIATPHTRSIIDLFFKDQHVEYLFKDVDGVVLMPS